VYLEKWLYDAELPEKSFSDLRHTKINKISIGI
jgi:hypothetical protein